MFVKEAYPRVIKNSRKEKSIEIFLKTYKGKFSCSAPSGKSTGESEVAAFNKEGFEKSFKLVKEFCYSLKNKNFLIKAIDDLMQIDSLVSMFEKSYGKMGGSVIYALHGVFLKAAASDNNLELWEFIHRDVNAGEGIKIPMPVGNCIGGGLHSEAINHKRPDFQEFLLIPNEETFSKAVTKNIHAYHLAQKLLNAKYKNDENAWRTDKTNEEVIDILMQVAYEFNLQIGLDVASSTFYDKNYYEYKNKKLRRDRSEQIDYMLRLIRKYELFYVEDPMNENDFLGFKSILSQVNKTRTMIVGDDLTTTNFRRLKKAISSKSINAIIIKPNQIGSLIEVKKVVELCKQHKIIMIFSHRSGETMDNILGDYAVGFGADFIKTGIMGPERLVKLKRIIDIEKKLLINN